MKRVKKYKSIRRKRILLTMSIIIVVFFASFLLINNVKSKSFKEIFNEVEAKDVSVKADSKQGEDSSNKVEPVSAVNTEPLKEEKPPVVSASCLPSKYNFKWEVLKSKEFLKDFKRNYSISFVSPEEYADIPGVTTFRGNNYRNSPSYGFADIKEEKLEKIWFVKTGYIDIWTGVGWNGQPAIVRWDESLKNKMNFFPAKKVKKDLKEIIYATLDGKIYFLDLDDGKATRPPINVGYPHKGSVAVDPRGYPLLYAGQGIPERGGKKGPIGYRIFSLIDQRLLYFINGYDPDAIRKWGAFDSVPLIDKKTDTFIECGENGLLYTVKLNTDYNSDTGRISVNPEVIKYRYQSPISNKIGTENSPVIYKNYIYFADNSGLLQCVDLNTLKPVWIRDITDDTDGTMVLEAVSESEIWLYTACELDRQGKDGFSYIRKINALTGDLIWEKPVKCSYDPHTNGGALASPVVGKNDISDLIIFNVAKTGKNNNESKLLAIDKKTGKEVWVVDLDYYSWSSPVDVYTKDGKSYLIISDSGGFMRLLEGTTGKQLDSIPMEANIEASPAVYDDIIVVGTRGQKIWGVRIK